MMFFQQKVLQVLFVSVSLVGSVKGENKKFNLVSEGTSTFSSIGFKELNITTEGNSTYTSIGSVRGRKLATCGGGNRGDGVCPDGTCCSQWGWCGTTADHCSGSGGSSSGSGTCGGGSRGNGVCADGTCCSQWGWCGTTAEHCSGSGSNGGQGGSDGTCGNGSIGNGVCADGTCCSQYGWCGTSSAHCNNSPTPPPPPSVTTVQGFFVQTWKVRGAPFSGANLAVAFSGWANVDNALRDSTGASSSLQGERYLSIGGGNANGRITSQVLSDLNSAINAGRLNGYQGIFYDVEEGDSGLANAFATSFSIAKQRGLKIIVSVSHAAPYGISDANSLMRSFFANTDIDMLSPQLYTTGTEAGNSYATDANIGITWADYKQSRAAIVPSIVRNSYYQDAVSFFQNQGITLSGFIQWA